MKLLLDSILFWFMFLEILTKILLTQLKFAQVCFIFFQFYAYSFDCSNLFNLTGTLALLTNSIIRWPEDTTVNVVTTFYLYAFDIFSNLIPASTFPQLALVKTFNPYISTTCTTNSSSIITCTYSTTVSGKYPNGNLK